MSKAFKRISYITFGKLFEERINKGKLDDFHRVLKQSGYEGSLRLYLGMLVFGYLLAIIGLLVTFLALILFTSSFSIDALISTVLAFPLSVIAALLVPGLAIG